MTSNFVRDFAAHFKPRGKDAYEVLDYLQATLNPMPLPLAAACALQLMQDRNIFGGNPNDIPDEPLSTALQEIRQGLEEALFGEEEVEV